MKFGIFGFFFDKKLSLKVKKKRIKCGGFSKCSANPQKMLCEIGESSAKLVPVFTKMPFRGFLTGFAEDPLRN